MEQYEYFVQILYIPLILFLVEHDGHIDSLPDNPSNNVDKLILNLRTIVFFNQDCMLPVDISSKIALYNLLITETPI